METTKIHRLRVLVCGDREWKNYKLLKETILKVNKRNIFGPIECIIEGECRGADIMAREAAKELGIPFEPYPAEWNKYRRPKGKNPAGVIRNQQMLVEGKPNLVIGFHNNIENSRGTKDMLERAKKAGIETRLISE